MEIHDKNKKWYQKNNGIILSLIFFYPAGLFFMWHYAAWNKGLKWLYTILFIVLVTPFYFSATYFVLIVIGLLVYGVCNFIINVVSKESDNTRHHPNPTNIAANTLAQETMLFEKCPVCSLQNLFVYIHSTQFFGLMSKDTYTCKNCNAVFQKESEGYKLVFSPITINSANWNYYKGETLTTAEWERIANGGMSDARQVEVDKREEEERRIATERKRVYKLQSGDIQPIIVSFNLPSDENAYFQFEVERKADLDYIESHTIEHSDGKEKKTGVVGRSLGGAIIAGPVGAVIGGATAGSKIQSTSYASTTQHRVTKTEVIDKGTMLLTNTRFLFIGSQVISIPFNEIVEIGLHNEILSLKYSSMLKGEFYAFSSDYNDYKHYYHGIMRLTGRNKTSLKEEDILIEM